MKKLFLSVIMISFCFIAFAIPNYDEGRVQIKGVQLLQDQEDHNTYYYIPRYPRMATRNDGSYEFLFMKYVGKGNTGANGGIFHTLIEFSLPESEIQMIQDSLRVAVHNTDAKIAGPVPLQQITKDGENGLAGIQVVSSILNNNSGNNAFTQNIIYSGAAPLLPGSKAAISAKLTQEGATLLWESLMGKTSDVSVMISGYYEAYVKAYNAKVTAEVNTVYDHYSKISNYQDGFTRDQVRKITDNLLQSHVLKIESFDRTASLGLKSDEMNKLLDLVTDKLIELMFDVKSGWSQTPDREPAVEPDQIKGRQEQGFFSQVFSGSNNQPYVSDNQYVLKSRKDIRSNTFFLNLTQATTIKVPIFTSGNLNGLYDAFKNSPSDSVDKYFRLVDMDDPAFQKRDIAFIMDGGFAESFNDIFNFVSVSFRKQYGPDKQSVTNDLLFTRKSLDNNAAGMNQSITYPRLGAGDDWLNYQYRISWNLKGNNKTLHFPADDTSWITASDPGVTIMPPLQKKKITIEADRSIFGDTTSTSTIEIRFLAFLGGEAALQKSMILRPKDASNIHEAVLFTDLNVPMAYQITRHSADGDKPGVLKELKSDFLFINQESLEQ